MRVRVMGLVLILMAFIVFAINHTLIAPHGVFKNPMCDEMWDQGYFESVRDTAAHINCSEGYVEGKFKGKEWHCHYDKCFSYDSYDYDCTPTIPNITRYGTWCVWGSQGYFIGAISMMLYYLSGALVLSGVFIFFKNEIN